MKKLTQFIVLVLIATNSSFSFAWGDREQGILQGMAGLLLFQQLAKPQEPMLSVPPPVLVAPPIYSMPPPIYAAPPPAYYYRPTCYSVPQYDGWGRVLYYRQVCR